MAKSSWKSMERAAATDPEGLPGFSKAVPAGLLARFPMKISKPVLRLMQREDFRGPISRQFLPDPREASGGEDDPLGEEAFFVGPGLVRRFRDRLLALVSATCAAHCRHCNRKRYWKSPPRLATPVDIASALGRLKGVREVILSGGDPLMLADARLDDLLRACRSQEGIDVVRIHTRAPFSFPQRVTSGLVRVLRRHRPLWMLVQFNHASELYPAARRALVRLRDAGIPLLNQAVLLRGVNDSIRAQVELGRALVAAGVKPHYLFCLDRAPGTEHFAVPLDRAMHLVRGMQRHSGLMVPRVMVDLPGRAGKQQLDAYYRGGGRSERSKRRAGNEGR